MNGDHLFIGVNILPGKRPYVYAAMDRERTLAAIGRGDLAELVAYAAGSTKAWVCVNAPCGTGSGLLGKPAVRDSFTPPPTPKQQKHLRVADYELLLQGVAPARIFEQRPTPPVWIQNGLALYDQLTANGFQKEPTPGVAHLALEGNAEASFLALLPAKAYPANSLEGRIQRQLLCEELALPVPDTMGLFEEITRYRLLQGSLLLDNLHSEGELDALILAYTAWLTEHDPNAIITLGLPEESQIHLPGLPAHTPLARQFPLVNE
ncbi:MAG: hypothetical protein HPY76_07610 [Anaerolineae bacterium]|nr:hypothetical protein [Anaerolineae bacterium]